MDELIQKIDWASLRDDKERLISLSIGHPHNFDGLINLIDSIQDYAVDKLGISEEEVFNKMDDEADNERYPFNEGDDYYVISDSNCIVWSCWDDQSELFYDEKVGKGYFSTLEEAVSELKKHGVKTAIIYDKGKYPYDLKIS